MRAARLIVLPVLLLSAGVRPAMGQGDASGEFFAAYQEYQRAERLEREGRNEDAIAKFRYVAAQLAQIKSQNPDWQPLVVDFRLRKTQEAVLRLEGSLASPTLGPPPDLATVDEDETLPPVQTSRRPTSVPGPSISIAPPTDETAPPADSGPREPAGGDAGQLRRQLEMERGRNAELQAQIQRSEAEFSSVSMELEKTKVTVVDLTTRLRNLEESAEPAAPAGGASQEELDRLTDVTKELEDTLAAAGEEKQQLAERMAESERRIGELTAQATEAEAAAEKARAELAEAQGAAETARAEAEDAKARLGDLEAERESLVAERDTAREEAASARDELGTLTARVTELEGERTELIAARDTARQEAEEAKSALEMSAGLIEANQQLEEKLAEAAARIAGMESDAAEKAEVIAALNADLDGVRQELSSAQAKLKDDRERFDKLQAVNEQLLKEYDKVSGALAAVNLGEVTAAEAKLLQQENEVLRGIIMRQIKEQARREQAHRLAREEMERLEIRSDTLNDKINELAKPTLELTAAEQEMLKRPVVTLLDADAARMSAQVEVFKPQPENETAAAPAGEESGDPTGVTEDAAGVAETATEEVAAGPPAEAEPTPDVSSGGEEATAAPAPAPELPAEVLALVAEAREAFVKGDFAGAEALYQRFVDEQPDNVVALANLGVAQFRQGKLTAAQLALERAVKVDPNDAFSLTTLGAVMIEQSRMEDAIGYLERANESRADDPITLNYLGVASSQLGQFGKAEQSLRRAITVHPEYAEAHFNLAVIYATAKPPSMALAKRHYEKALELGAGPDKRLANLLQAGAGG